MNRRNRARYHGSALLATSVEITSPPAHGQVQWDAASAHATYVPAAGFLGLDRFRYTVRDAGGAISNEATVHVTVVDPEGTPWQNPRDPADVNGDGEIYAVDVLTVINDINRNQSRLLPAPSPDGDFPLPYLDVNGDGYVSPADALLAINSVNRRAGGSGEAMVGAVGEAFDPRPISPAAPPITDPPAARPLADGSAAMARRIGVGESDRGSLHPAAQPTATMAMLAADAVLRAFAAAEDWWEDFFDPLIMSRTPRQEVFSPDDIAIAQP